MSHNPNTVKSQDYINEGGRKSDVLLSTIEELERTKKENRAIKEALKENINENLVLIEYYEKIIAEQDESIKIAKYFFMIIFVCGIINLIMELNK